MQVFGNNVIAHGYPLPWPAISPDPLRFFCGLREEQGFQNTPRKPGDIKEAY